MNVPIEPREDIFKRKDFVKMITKWFVMKKTRETATEVIYRKASKYFDTKKKAQTEMNKLRKKSPKATYKIGGN